MKIKYVGGKVIDGEDLIIGKEYEVVSEETNGFGLIIFCKEKEKLDNPLFVYKEEVEKFFEIIK